MGYYVDYEDARARCSACGRTMHNVGFTLDQFLIDYSATYCPVCDALQLRRLGVVPRTEAPVKRWRWQSTIELLVGAFGIYGVGWLCARSWSQGGLLLILATPAILIATGFVDARLAGHEGWLGACLRIGIAIYSARRLRR